MPKMALCLTWTIRCLKSMSSHMRPKISPLRIPVWSAISRKVWALGLFTLSTSRRVSWGARATFSAVLRPPGFSILLTGDFATSPFSCAALKMLRKWIKTLDWRELLLLDSEAMMAWICIGVISRKRYPPMNGRMCWFKTYLIALRLFSRRLGFL